ncbi:MAG: nucleotidyl transferase AbiEii/AbiGii toxin family protein [Chloroflexota bacterium]
MALSGIEVGFLLDRQWHLMRGDLRGDMDASKQPALIALAQVLHESGAAYALIGGVALQAHQSEPRTTVDIDLAVTPLDSLPRDALEASGFVFSGSFAPSENWVGPGGVPVQFTGDPALIGAIGRAITMQIGGVPVRVISRSDLLHEKLRAGADPARRRSKRLQDLADAEGLLEATPELRAELSDEERHQLDALPG